MDPQRPIYPQRVKRKSVGLIYAMAPKMSNKCVCHAGPCTSMYVDFAKSCENGIRIPPYVAAA